MNGCSNKSQVDFGMDEEGNTFPAAMILGWDLISQFCWSFDMCEKTVLIQPGGYDAFQRYIMLESICDHQGVISE